MTKQGKQATNRGGGTGNKLTMKSLNIRMYSLECQGENDTNLTTRKDWKFLLFFKL